MAAKTAQAAKAGGGPGTTTAGQVKSTMTPAFGARVAKRGGKRSTSGRGSRR